MLSRFLLPLTLSAYLALGLAQAIVSPKPTSMAGLPSQSTCTNVVCEDYVNTCHQTYGGCYTSCTGFPRPTFTDPYDCTKKTTTTTVTPRPSSTTCTSSICEDYVNTCHQTYGGCYAACSGLPRPTFTDPYDCTKTKTTSVPTVPTSKTSTAKSTCALTRCEDYINACHQTYGGCYAACSGLPRPTFTDPHDCTKTKTSSVPASTTSEASTIKTTTSKTVNSVTPQSTTTKVSSTMATSTRSKQS
jgi:hypothetical protein